MSKYRKKYYTQSSPINEPYSIGNTLVGCVTNHLMLKGSDLQDMYQDAALNSIAGTLYKLAKNCQPGKKYADILGTPTGTVIIEPLPKEALNNSAIRSIQSQYLSQASEDVFFAMVYDLLVSDYAYNPETKTVTIDDTEYPLEEITVDDDNHLLLNYIEYITHGGGPSATIEQREHYIDLGITVDDLESDYLVVKYLDENNETHYYVYNMSDHTNEFIDTWFSKNTVAHYPSFFARKNKKSIKIADPEYYETSRKALKRMGLDWEDLVDNFNGDAQLNNKTDEDDDYKDSIKDCTDICLTFALDVTTNDQRVMRYMYEFFKLIEQSGNLNSNKITYRHKAFNYNFSWGKITHNFKSGNIAKFHRFTTEGIEVSTVKNITVQGTTVPIMTKTKCLRIRKQIDNSRYEEFLIEDVKFTSYNNGHAMERHFPLFANLKPYTYDDLEAIKNGEIEEDNNECLIPILPIIIRRRMGGILGNDILFIGMRSIHNTYIKIKKKWYESTWFAVIRIVVSIVIIILTWGGGTPFVLAANAAVNIALNLLIMILIMLAIKLAVKMVCKVFHITGLFLNIINTAVNIVCMVCLPGGAGFIALSGAIADCVMSGSFSLQSVASALSGVATTALMMVNPALGVMIDLITNPQFYYALQTHNWSAALMQMAMSIGKAVFTQVAKGMADAAKTSGSLIDATTKQFDYTKLVFDTPKTMLQELGTKFSEESLKLVAELPGMAMQQKAENVQQKTSELNNQMLALSNKQARLDEVTSSIFAKQQQCLAFVTDKYLNIQEEDEYDFYRFNKGFTGTFVQIT